MKINNEKIVTRWNGIMSGIGCEHLTINTNLSEIASKKQYYGTEKGVTTDWMLEEAKYWLSCYYESGNCRCDERYESKEGYKVWASNTGKLKRLIATLEKMENSLIVEW